MNKTVLFLMNGLGIERKDSYNIYSSEIMPNLDCLTKKELFTSVNSPALNLEDAYKYFSIGTLSPLAMPYIDNLLENNTLNQNPKFDSFHQAVFHNQGNIHFFCFIENEKTYDTVRNFIQAIDPDNQKKIYIHFVLSQTSESDYISISKILSRFQFGLPANVERGFVLGQSILENSEKINERTDFVRMFYRGVGEIWKDVDTKLNSLYSLHINPNEAKAFYINSNFTLGEDDLLFFFNYEHYDFEHLINLIKSPNLFITNQFDVSKIKYYSLFPLKNKETTNYLYEDIISDISLAKAMEQIGGTSLVLTDKKNINMVNYMCNGLSNSSNSHVKYVLTDNGILYHKEQMRLLIDDPSYQLIIINHDISELEDEISIKQELQKIDQNLGMIVDLCKDKYPLLISSLYGVNKEIIVKDNKKELVNFSGIVPAVFIDSNVDKKNYRLVAGDTYTLLTTCLKVIKPELKVNSLLRKKSLVETILFKNKK